MATPHEHDPRLARMVMASGGGVADEIPEEAGAKLTSAHQAGFSGTR
jgi:hypothetical protein